jgi:hypothetical protein
LTIAGLICCIFLKDDSVGVKTWSWRVGDREASTGDGDWATVTLRAIGGAFLGPWGNGSRNLVGVVVTIVGISWEGSTGIVIVGFFNVGYLLLDEFGTLKLGVIRDWLRIGRDGPPYVE